MRHITLITTGGTIEKTYDDLTGELSNRRTVVRRMLRRLRLEDATVSIIELLSKDSLHMTEADRGAIADACRAAGAERAGHPAGSCIVILHGTDTLATTGETLLKTLGSPSLPIVLTGAMRPFEMVRSDALQNLTEAIFAGGILPAGIYCVTHGRALAFPGVVKDRDRRTFISAAPPARA